MVLEDNLEGRGRHSVTRCFVTPLKAEASSEGIVLTCERNKGAQSFLLYCPNAEITLKKMLIWKAYGKSQDGYSVTFSVEAQLPWSGQVHLEVI